MKSIMLLLAVFMLAGCGPQVSTVAMIDAAQFDKYKQAYIEPHPQDEFSMTQALVVEMKDLGLSVVGVPYADPQETDLLIKYTYDDGWDMTKYLKTFNIQLMDAKTKAMLVSTSYNGIGLWYGVRDGRLETAFNEIRSKIGKPPTKQFEQ